MEKKNYTSPTVSYVGPEMNECKEVEAPFLVAVASNVLVAATNRLW